MNIRQGTQKKKNCASATCEALDSHTYFNVAGLNFLFSGCSFVTTKCPPPPSPTHPPAAPWHLAAVQLFCTNKLWTVRRPCIICGRGFGSGEDWLLHFSHAMLHFPAFQSIIHLNVHGLPEKKKSVYAFTNLTAGCKYSAQRLLPHETLRPF